MKEILITATVLILWILLIRQVFRGKISSRLQYALWLLVVLRLMIPVSAQFDLGPLSRFRLLDLVEGNEGGITKRLEETIRLEEPIHMIVDSGNILFRLFVTDEVRETLKDMPDDGSTSVFMAGTLGFSRLDVLWFLWRLGVLIVGAWIIVTNIVFSRRLKKTRRPFALPEEVRTAVLRRRKGRLPVFYLAEGISSPCLYGLPGREAVYLTADVAADVDRLRHVVVHELVHKKHGDSFWALLRGVLVTVYWFHPLVWIAAVCSKRDCELACDEAALAMLGEEERISYGETLLSIITRRGHVSDLLCTATTMTGSGRSVKERIRFIAEKPKVLYAAVGAVLLLVMAICFFVFTRDAQFGGVTVDSIEGLTVTGADMQIHLPASIGGISGCLVDEENDDIIIYHTGAQKEVGRFSNMPVKDALQLVDEGREVTPLGNHGYNYLLRAYLGEPYMETTHTYTPAEEVTTHSYTPAEGETQGVLSHEDVYLSNETITEMPIGDGSDFVVTHSYTPAEGVAGTDSNDTTDGIENDDTTYVIDEAGSSNPMLNDDHEMIPLQEEQAVDYLPNENITTTVYQPNEVNVDEIGGGCYVYVKADTSKAPEKYREEMAFIDSELKKAGEGAVILSLNRKVREQLFDALTENRTPYVGDNSKVGNLLTALPLPPTMNRTGDFSLQTLEEPYSLRFSYEMSTDLFTQEDRDMLYFNAAMLFYAIGNVQEITMDIQHPSADSTKASYLEVYYREELEEELPILRTVDYEESQPFREGLSELQVAVEERLQE